MHPAQSFFRPLLLIVVVSAPTFAFSATARADRLPLVGSGISAPHATVSGAAALTGLILTVDPLTVPCDQQVTFGDVLGGDTPGTNYDGLLWSGGLLFAERFLGQGLSYGGDFDVISGVPSNPLTPLVGLPGQNLDVFAYTTNVLTGLGPLGYPDLDAIGEGSIAMYFPSPQSRVSFEIVGGNGGSATLGFYRADGSLIDNVTVSGLADLAYGFATSDDAQVISGILIQSTDPSGIGVLNICHTGGIVNTHPLTWGSLKSLYR